MPMMFHAAPSIRTGLPQTPELLGRNPLAGGLVLAEYGEFLHNAAGRERPTRFGGKVVAAAAGRALKLNGTNEYVRHGADIGGVDLFADSARKWAVVIFAKKIDTVGSVFFAKAGSTPANRTFQLFWSEADNKFYTYLRGTFTAFGSIDNNYHQITVTWDGTTAQAYVDSATNATLSVGTAALESSEAIIIGARTGGTAFWMNGEVGYVLIYNRAISQAEHLAILRNPGLIFAPHSRRIWLPDAGGGAADLVLQNSAHAHSAASPTLSSAHALIAAASAHAHTAANLALSSAMGLSVSPATHAHAADAPALSAALFLLIQNTLHAHAAGNVTLDNTGALVLTIADALHAHTANPLTISQAVTLAVANALHPHTADAPTLQTLVSLMIAHAQHGHAADNIAFGIAVIELVQDLMLDALYQAGDFGLAVDCLLGQAAFTAFLDTADDDYFAAQSTGHTLRYRLGVPLQTGDQVTIDGTLYRVNGAARQINSGEMRAALVRVPS